MNFLLLDIRTVIGLLVISNMLAVIILLSYRRHFDLRKLYLQFITGSLFQAAAWVLLGLRNLIPDIFSVYLGNCILIWGFALALPAFAMQKGAAKDNNQIYRFIAGIGTVIFLAFGHSPGIRVALASFICGAIFGTGSALLFYQSGTSWLKKFLALLAAIQSSLLLIRGTMGLEAPLSFTLLSQNLIQGLTFTSVFVFTVSSGIGFLLLMKEYADKMLHESEQKFSLAFHSSPNAIILIHATDGKIIEVNKNFELLSGFNASDFTGKSIYDFNLWDDPVERDKLILQLQATGSSEPKEIYIRTKDNRRITGLHSAVLLHMQDDIFVLSTISDITARKEAETKILQYSDELKELNSVKDRFLSIVAHDLRSPFNGFLNLSLLLATEIDSLSKEEILDMAKMLHNALNQYYGFLSELLEWTRFQTKNYSLQINEINISSTVNSAIEPLRLAAAGKQIEIELDIPDNLVIDADENLIKLLLRNLFSNAVKFSFAGGRISISAAKYDGELQIVVSDSGVGMTQAEADNLFNESPNRSVPGTADETGTGLGLMLCAQIIKKHNGTIKAISSPSKGSRFYIVLPCSVPNNS